MSSGTHVRTSFGRIRPREDAHGVRDKDACDCVLETSMCVSLGRTRPRDALPLGQVRPDDHVIRPKDFRNKDVRDCVLGT